MDIQLLTFHAFESGERLFLARQVETVAPTKRRRHAGLSKEDYRAILHRLAEAQGVGSLLTEVADYVEAHLPCYAWPGKTAYSFSLQGRTSDGASTLHAYVTLYVNRKAKGHLSLAFRPRSMEVAGEALSEFVEEVPEARTQKNPRRPVQLEIDSASWARNKERLGLILSAIKEGWRAGMDADDNGSVP